MLSEDGTTQSMWILLILLSLSSIGAAACSFIFGLEYVSMHNYNDTTGACGKFSIFTGCALTALTISWGLLGSFYKSRLYKFRKPVKIPQYELTVNNNIMPRDCNVPANIEWAKIRASEVWEIRNMMWRLRLIILFCLMMAMLIEVSSTGLFWWTNNTLQQNFAISENCFCTTKKEFQPYSSSSVINKCPVMNENGQALVCLSVYVPQKIKINNRTSYTLDCQKLSGEDMREPLCVDYNWFWTWFKVLRVLLPLMVILKLPLIWIMASKTLMKPPPKVLNYQIEDQNWFDLESLVSGRTVDQAHFHGKKMLTTLKKIPPVEERLGPYGAEQEKQDSSIISTVDKQRQTASIKKCNGALSVPCPKVPSLVSPIHLKVIDSPPDKDGNTFSTPLLPIAETPNFSVISQLEKQTPTQSYMQSRLAPQAADFSGARLSSFAPSHKSAIESVPSEPEFPPPPPPLDSNPVDLGPNDTTKSQQPASTTTPVSKNITKKPRSEGPPQVRLSGTRIGLSMLHQNDLNEIKMRAGNRSFDWTKLP